MLMKQREEPLLQACVAAVPRWAVDGVVAAHDDVARIFCRTQCRFNPLPMHLSPCRWRLARLAAEKRGVDQNEINASVAIVSVVHSQRHLLAVFVLLINAVVISYLLARLVQLSINIG